MCRGTPTRHEPQSALHMPTGGQIGWACGRLKPSTQTISRRLPAALWEDLRLLANKRDVPDQFPLKIFLAERVAQEILSHS